MFYQDSDELLIEDDSGSDSIDSSDDELDVMLNGTPEQKHKLHHDRAKVSQKEKQSHTQSEHVENDFEKEMNAELNKALCDMEQRRWASKDQPPAEGKAHGDEKKSEKSVQFYEDVYFDSDDEKDEHQQNGQKPKSENRRLTDDELLYDPHMDDDDQNWVNARRQRYQPQHRENRQNQRSGGQKRQAADRRVDGVQPLRNSDALLDCPACMTTLCMDCQQHSLYKNQYRAMFVMNCTVDMAEKLSYPKSTGKRNKKRKHSAKTSGPRGMSMNEQYKQMTSKTESSSHTESELSRNAVASDKSSATEKFVKTECPVNSTVDVDDSSVKTNLSCASVSSTQGAGQCRGENITEQNSNDTQAEAGGVEESVIQAEDVEEDIYHPVKCSECNTVVAVFDSDEVYHFFNVLTSYG